MQQMNLVTVNMKNGMTEDSPQHEEQDVAVIPRSNLRPR